MNKFKVNGIVLHSIKYSENSLILKILTDVFGLQSYIITGVRSKKSGAKASLFQPFSMVELIVSHSSNKHLQRIYDVNISNQLTTLPYDIIKSSIALFLNEVLNAAIKETNSDDKLFEFIKNSILILDLETESCANFHIYFLLRLTKFLGFYPLGKYDSENLIFDYKEGRFVNQLPNHRYFFDQNQSKLFQDFGIANYENSKSIKLNSLERKQLLNSLVDYYSLHIDSFPEIKSSKVLEIILTT
jgi:DNA repair protein RecO (recombination protein O)